MNKKLNKKIIENVYPLTSLQEGLLFQNLYAPESDAYFVQFVLEFEGNLDEESMKGAWQALTDHHPILRTGVVWERLDQPLQYVLKCINVPFEILNWKEKEKEFTRNQLLQVFIQEDRKKGFDLSKAPLFRIILIKHLQNKYTLIWSQHHILTDGWSNSILMADLFKAYESLKSKKLVSLTPRRPYRDYIARLQEQNKEKAEAFFRESLSSITEPTRLSFKEIISSCKEKDYDTYIFTFSEKETKSLETFAKENSLTLNTLLQGAVGKVLSSYTQKSDLVMGVTLSGRSIEESTSFQ